MRKHQPIDDTTLCIWKIVGRPFIFFMYLRTVYSSFCLYTSRERKKINKFYNFTTFLNEAWATLVRENKKKKTLLSSVLVSIIESSEETIGLEIVDLISFSKARNTTQYRFNNTFHSCERWARSALSGSV